MAHKLAVILNWMLSRVGHRLQVSQHSILKRVKGHELIPSSSDIDLDAPDALQDMAEIHGKPRAGGWTGINEKVDIAVRPGLASRDRAKNPDVVGSVSRCNLLDVIALFAQQLLEIDGVRWYPGLMPRHGFTPSFR